MLNATNSVSAARSPVETEEDVQLILGGLING